MEENTHNVAEAHRRYGVARMQYEQQQLEPLLRFGRALADPMRLRIMAKLAQKAMYGQELAEALEVSPPTISHHLSLLKAAGLVYAQRENNYQYYELSSGGLRKCSDLLTIEYLQSINSRPELPDQPEPPAEDADRVMMQEAFFVNGRLLGLPGHSRAHRFVMEKIVEAFELKRAYSEKEVNEILKGIFDDPATLRRSLVDLKLMTREYGVYQRVEPQK